MTGGPATDAGYTLGECLVALFVIGLAMASLSAGVMSIGRQQARAVAVAAGSRDLRQVQEGLDRFLEGRGPFVGPAAEPFTGASSGFQFKCGVDDDCRVWLAAAAGGMAVHLASRTGARTLPLKGARSAQFVYAGARTIGPVWPADAATLQPLKSIGLMVQTDAGPLAVASVPVWVDQSPYCDFDAILKDCRR